MQGFFKSHTGALYHPLNEEVICEIELGLFGIIKGIGPAYLCCRLMEKASHRMKSMLRSVFADPEATYPFVIQEGESLQVALLKFCVTMLEDCWNEAKKESAIYENTAFTLTLCLVANSQIACISLGNLLIIRKRADKMRFFNTPNLINFNRDMQQLNPFQNFPLQYVGQKDEYSFFIREAEYFETDQFYLLSPSLLEYLNVAEFESLCLQGSSKNEAYENQIKMILTEASVFRQCPENMSLVMFTGSATERELELGSQIDQLAENELGDEAEVVEQLPLENELNLEGNLEMPMPLEGALNEEAKTDDAVNMDEFKIDLPDLDLDANAGEAEEKSDDLNIPSESSES